MKQNQVLQSACAVMTDLLEMFNASFDNIRGVRPATVCISCRQYLQQMVDGKFDDDLPRMGPRSTTEQQYSIDMERYMSEFKMQVHQTPPLLALYLLQC